MGRVEVDEKQLLSELSKFIGAAKASIKAARNAKRAAKSRTSTAGSAEATPPPPASKGDAAAQRGALGGSDATSSRGAKKAKMARRKACRGATIRITLKGGYSALNRGTPGRRTDDADMRAALRRAELTLRHAMKHAAPPAEEADAPNEAEEALEAARAEREQLCAEEERGACEQEAAPDAQSSWPHRAPVGQRFASIVKATGGSVTQVPPQPLSAQAPPSLLGDGGGGGLQSLFFVAREEPCTKCIVKVKGPCSAKATGTLASMKAVNYFRTNFGQLLKREIAAHGAAGAHSTAASASGKRR